MLPSFVCRVPPYSGYEKLTAIPAQSRTGTDIGVQATRMGSSPLVAMSGVMGTSGINTGQSGTIVLSCHRLPLPEISPLFRAGRVEGVVAVNS